ncbi:hypothetical protein OG21DRAFT_1515416 [Imleria badia]|nr:hypothetical protein OG21DRAFT_1515416 [Imleria badia]
MTTTLNCSVWMQNQNGQNPCMIAAQVGQLCNAHYTVSQTNFQESNYVPSATMINGCTCSWSIYNLLSACSFCVGQDQYIGWFTWITNCGSNASNTSYLPSGLELPQGIPFWAATNPSTWENAVFNLTQAAYLAAAALPAVTGGPSTSTMTDSCVSSVSVGAIVGGVLGAITFIVIGGLIVFWAVRRYRRQRTHTTSIGPSGPNASQPVTIPAPSIRNRTTVQPSRFWHTRGSPGPISHRVTSSVHSTTSLAATSLLASPISPGFSSNGHNVAQPLTDAADMISPFFAMSSTRQANRSNTSLPTSKAAEALSERLVTPPGQRARLNPPAYSPASAEPGSSWAASAGAERVLKKKQTKQNGSVSGMTMISGHSRTSTKESATAVLAGPQTEESHPRAATPGVATMQSVQSAKSGGVGGDDGDGRVEMTHGGRAGVSDRRPPAV